MSKTRETLAKVCDAISDRKGDRLTVLDISEISTFTDFFVICNGSNRKQNQAICDAIRERLKTDERLSPSSLEGYDSADWILMDYIDFVIHIFSERSRDFYKLEKLWSDGIELQPRLLTA